MKIKINGIAVATLALAASAQPALASNVVGVHLPAVGVHLPQIVGGAIPGGIGGVAAIAAVSLVLGVQLIKRRKK